MKIGILSDTLEYCKSVIEVVKHTSDDICYILTYKKEILDLSKIYPHIKIINFTLFEKGHKLKTEIKCRSLVEYIKSNCETPDLQITYGFNVINKILWDFPRFKTINVHFSLLPKYKGSRPLFLVLFNKEKESGITIHYVTDDIDSGSIINQLKFNLTGSETIKSLNNKSVIYCKQLLKDALLKIKSQHKISN